MGTVVLEAVYPYTYTDDDGSDISFREGDRFLLIERSNEDWWKVQRTGVFSGKSVCFVPATYMEEKQMPPHGGERPTNHYVNLEVFQKIVQNDVDGLEKLDTKSLVVSKDSSDDLLSPVTPDSSFEGSEGGPELMRLVSPTGVKQPVFPPVPTPQKSNTLPSGWRKYRDTTGRSFYYNEESEESRWKPPRTSISDDISEVSDSELAEQESFEDDSFALRRKSVDVALHRKLEKEAKQREAERAQTLSTTSSNTDQESSSNYDQTLTICTKEGTLHRQKIREGGKFIKRPPWQQIYCSVIGSTLVFYKDANKAAPKSSHPSGKPESSFDLHGASLDHVPKEKSGGKKYVFQVSSYQQQNIQLLASENEVDYSEWVKVIIKIIEKLEREDPLPKEESPTFDGPRNLRPGADKDGTNKSATLPKRLLPHTPTSRGSRTFSMSSVDKTPDKEEKEKETKKDKHKDKHKDKEKGFFGRRPSSKAYHEEDKEKVKIKDRLRRYLASRPSIEVLEAKGIVKDFVFGYPIEKVCEREESVVPKCLINIINEVERRGVELDGIYRVSGNLSAIQKLRVMFDNGEWVDFKNPVWNDTHVLTGALKLYFRELPDPLIPFSLFDKFIDAARLKSRGEQIKVLSNLIKLLPRENRETLNLLMSHLCRVAKYNASNRMDTSNLSIVFGPTLMFPDPNSINIHTNMSVITVYQSRCIELLLLLYDDVFEDSYTKKGPSDML